MANPSTLARPPGRASPSSPSSPGLRCRVRLADGRTFTGELSPERHRAIQLGLLHSDSDGLVELAAGPRHAGVLQINTRNRPDHFLPGGASAESEWLDGLLALAAHHAERGDEVFVAPAVRSEPRGDKRAVAHTRALWVDVDRPDELPALWAFLAERPCHLLIESGGSGGAHAYWKLDRPLPATHELDGRRLEEPIERAHLRLIHRLGVGEDGRPNVADPAVKDRSRVMRLAGTINFKTGDFARIIEADFRLAPYPIAALVGDLPDPKWARSAAKRPSDGGEEPDPYKRIPPPVYFAALAGIDVPARGGLVRCPAHADDVPSCSVSADPARGWCCHAGTCLARGAIYDLASAVLGGPYGHELRGEAFKRARAYVVDVFGDARGPDHFNHREE